MWLSVVAVANASTNAVTITGLQDGKRLDFAPSVRQLIFKQSLELLQTASYEADQSVATEDRFKQGQQNSDLHLIFHAPQTVTFRFSTTGSAIENSVAISEMLIPISATNWPAYILVREQDKIRAFAKYHTQSMQALQDILKER